MSLLDRWGVGVTQVIGVGGRDLSAEVGGRMAALAVAGPRRRPGHRGDPPGLQAAVARGRSRGRPGGRRHAARRRPHRPGARRRSWTGRPAGRPDAGGRRPRAAAPRSASPPPDLATAGCRSEVDRGRRRPDAERTLVRGLFSGGTLCYEALVILLEPRLGAVYSNTPARRAASGLPAPPAAHVCLDLGEEEYTKGRPHPMIDPEARLELLRRGRRGPDVAVVMLDVVLGHGAHADPAGALAPACASRPAAGGPRSSPTCSAPSSDPQGFGRQRATSRGGRLPSSPRPPARAALAAAAIAVPPTRRLVDEPLP